MKNNIKGFSLVELLIVVVVIGIIAAIAVPNLLAARRSANEGSAVSSLRMLYSAQRVYANSYGSGNYAGTIGSGTTAVFGELFARQLIDEVLATSTKSGYNFVGGRQDLSDAAAATFFISANPLSTVGVTQTGARRFGVSTDGVIKSDATLSQLSVPFDGNTIITANAYGD